MWYNNKESVVQNVVQIVVQEKSKATYRDLGRGLGMRFPFSNMNIGTFRSALLSILYAKQEVNEPEEAKSKQEC